MDPYFFNLEVAPLTEYGWQVKEVKSSLQQPHELIAHLDKSAAADYQKAARHGISASFHGWPKKERPGVFEVRSLLNSPKQKGDYDGKRT